jgi:hypothetical protein
VTSAITLYVILRLRGSEHVTLGPALWVSELVTEVTSSSMTSEVQFVEDAP